MQILHLHLADAFIQSDVLHFKVHIYILAFPENRIHNLGVASANAVLSYRKACLSYMKA